MNPQGAIAYQTANQIGNNLQQSFTKRKDENAIESILAEANSTNDPKVLQDTIGKILSNVSPERQGAAIKYLENAYKNVKDQEKLGRERKSAVDIGVNPDLPPTLQVAQFKEKSKSGRIENANKVFNQPDNLFKETNLDQNQVAITQPDVIPDVIPEGNQGNQGNQRKQQLLQLTGHPDREVSERAKAELKNIETNEKLDRADTREMRKETLPLRQKIIEEANTARESIRNKTNLIELIDKGDLDDPTYAIIAENMPFNLGKRLLSKDTVVYKGGLVDEFGDLKNIFKGATRVKEVEIYENKLADLYLTDSQKKAILKSRINAAKIPIIREEAAAEVERKYPNISALQFNAKVDELTQPKINELFNSIWGDQKAVLDQAEKRKNMKLDVSDPDDLEIVDQILKEAKGNYIEAEKIAKKKGYKF